MRAIRKLLHWIWAGLDGLRKILHLLLLLLVFGVIGGIFVFIIALGVLNTMLMSVLERTGEIGVLRAMGLRPAGVVDEPGLMLLCVVKRR